MTGIFLTLPVAVLMCGGAFAQTTDPTTKTGGSETMTNCGTSWSQSIGSTFYSDREMSTMRSQDEVSTGWWSLTQEDRDSVMAECARHESDTSIATAAGTGITTGITTLGTAAETGTATDATAGTDAATSGTMTATTGIKGENMKALCDMVGTF